VRSNLTALRNSPDSSPHVLSIAIRILEKMDELFGSGAEGTVAAHVINKLKKIVCKSHRECK
jgi:hypothetical protein